MHGYSILSTAIYFTHYGEVADLVNDEHPVLGENLELVWQYDEVLYD